MKYLPKSLSVFLAGSVALSAWAIEADDLVETDAQPDSSALATLEDNTSGETPAPAAEEQAEEVVLIAPSVSALATLGSADFDAAPLQSGPRRGATFFFNIPGLETVEVSPN